VRERACVGPNGGRDARGNLFLELLDLVIELRVPPEDLAPLEILHGEGAPLTGIASRRSFATGQLTPASSTGRHLFLFRNRLSSKRDVARGQGAQRRLLCANPKARKTERMNRYFGASIAALVCTATTVYADSGVGGLGVGVDAGTLGAGVTLVKSIVPHRLSAEIDLNAPIKVSYDTSVSGTRYDGKLRMQGNGALLNFFPSESSLFHVSGGAYFNQNKVDLNGQFSAGGFTLNGRQYSSSELTSLGDDITFRKSAPYLGVGWGDGSAGPGWHFNANAGVLYQGSAKVDVIGTTPYLTGSPQYNALFSSLDAQRSIIAEDLNQHLRWYPVITIGLLYGF